MTSEFDRITAVSIRTFYLLDPLFTFPLLNSLALSFKTFCKSLTVHLHSGYIYLSPFSFSLDFALRAMCWQCLIFSYPALWIVFFSPCHLRTLALLFSGNLQYLATARRREWKWRKLSQISPFSTLVSTLTLTKAKERSEQREFFHRTFPLWESLLLYLMHYACLLLLPLCFSLFFSFPFSPPTHFSVTFAPSFFSQLVLFLTHLHSLRTLCQRLCCMAMLKQKHRDNGRRRRVKERSFSITFGQFFERETSQCTFSLAPCQVTCFLSLLFSFVGPFFIFTETKLFLQSHFQALSN